MKPSRKKTDIPETSKKERISVLAKTVEGQGTSLGRKSFCKKCKKEIPYSGRQSQSSVEICMECATEIAQEEKDQHLADLKKLSAEERVAKIESALYDLQRTRHVCVGPTVI